MLHQVLQWHAMLSSPLPPTELVSSKANMFWDGVFHLYAWVTTTAAVVVTVRASPRVEHDERIPVLAGGALAGWGLFNVVEGAINHQLLGLHHVHPGEGQMAWDVAFLLSGLIFTAAGVALALRKLKRTVA